MDQDTIVGIQKMREDIRSRHSVRRERDEYKKALEDILNAHTVGRMIEIANRVLKENRK